MVPRQLISAWPARFTCFLVLLVFSACGGSTTTAEPPGAGEACHTGGVCAEDLICEDGTCVEITVTTDVGEGDVPEPTPDTEDRDAGPDTGDDGDASPAPPDVPEDVEPTPADVDASPEDPDTSDVTDPVDILTPDTIEEGCTEPADCADAFDAIPACQISTCNVATGECFLADLEDGLACDDGNPCSYNDTCSAGECSGLGADCDDSNPCTDDECGDDGCEHTTKVGTCDDGNMCTVDDFCIAGACLGEAMNCEDAPDNECLGNGALRAYEDTGVCDVNTGICDFAFQDVTCLEGCYEGACASNKCQVEPPGTQCDDELACTENDSCTIDGTCSGIAIDCSSLMTECMNATCDVADGVCKPIPFTDGTNCDDVDACTASDHCEAGECVAGSLVACDDSNPCTDDSCDPLTGDCIHLPNTGSCDDSDPCTVEDTCAGGFCFGSDKDCSDGDQCTDDVCTPTGLCVNPLSSDSPCDDADPCTVDDMCGGGFCIGVAITCEDGNPCTEEACQGDLGCVVIGDADVEIPCFSGDPATIGVGACAEGLRTCSAGALGPCVGQVLPANEICGNGDDDNCDGWVDEPQCSEPPVGLADAMLEWSVQSSGPGMLMGQWADLSNGSYQQTFGGFTTQPPMTAGVLHVEAGPLSAQANFSTTPYPAEWLAGHIRNLDVYADDPVVHAVVQVRDAVGRPVVAPGQVNLRLMQNGQEDILGQCFVGPNSICNVALAVPDGWFSEDVPTAVSARFELPGGDETNLSTIFLAKKPPVEALPDPGFVATLPYGPQHAGSTFIVPLFGVASASVIESFDVTIPFDPAVLSVEAVTIDARYNGVHNPKYDELLIVGVRELDTLPEDATGQVHLADITFRVRHDAAEGAEVPFAPEVASLYDLQNVPLTGDDGAYVVHVQSGEAGDSIGYVEVAENPIRSIYATPHSNELFNTSGIYADGAAVTSPMQVFAVRAFAPDEEITDEADCAAEFSANLKFTGACIATLDDTTTSPASSANVTVTHGVHATTVPFRIWQPVYPVAVKVDDNFLERITGVLNASCEEELIQQTRVHADVSFRHSTVGTDVITGRLDEHVTFVASGGSANLITVEGNVVQGLSAGQAAVAVQGPVGEVGSANIIVSDTPTAVEGIDVVVPTEIEFQPFSPTPPFLHVGTSLAQATLIQSFDFEGKEGPILAYARFEDNRRMELTPEMGLQVTSLAPNALAVEQDPLRAVTLDSGSGDMVDARWVVCDTEVGSGVGHVEMDLPAPTDAVITLSADALARGPEDAAALAGLPICANVQVTLEYETGQSKDFTLDSRTFYDDAGGDPFNLFELQTVVGPGGEVSGIQVCSVAGANWGAFALLVTFTHAPQLGEFVVPVNIVQAQGLSLAARPWPAYAGSDTVAVTTFNQLEETGQYQQGSLESLLSLSDGTFADVSTSAETSFAMEPSSNVFSIAQPNRLSANGAGAVQITATFGDQVSPTVALTASSTGVNVTTLGLDFPSTFKGVANWKTEDIEVTATFDDGSIITNAEDIAGLLTYESSHPDAATLDSSGTATLHANHRQPVTLTVTAATSGSASTVDTACNLEPAVGDIDLGQVFGIAHPDVLPGEDFVMPVRVNTGSQALGALDLTFEYDPAVIQVVSGEPGGGWPGGQLEITLNDPPGEVHIVAAASVGSNASGNALEVARINFQGLKSQETNLTLIQGSIRKLLANATNQTPIGAALGADETRAIVAGHGWLDPDCAGGLDPSDILGNADGDCEFSVADVSYGLNYLAELLDEGGIAGFQVNELDADRSGVVDVADVVYLIRVLAGKFRFATLSVIENGGLGDTTTLEVTLRDASGEPYGEQATVWLELGTALNSGMTVTAGSSVATTEDGIVVETDNVGGGIYRFSATDFAAEEDIGVAIVVRTVDGLGETGDDRVVALHGSPWLNPGSQYTPFATVNFGGNAAPLCLPGECSDGNPCTDDACDAATGCVFTNNTNLCDDEDECTEVDRCTDGVCVGIAIPGCGDETACFNDECEPGETCENCPWDCGECPTVCGDNTCDWDEDCESCAADCGACAGDCCAGNDTPGCDDPEVTACVCAIDPYCCSGKWEANCSNKAVLDCSAQCEGPGNGICEDGENCLNSQGDCECSCGDTLCTTDEDCGSCPEDCDPCPLICGDGECNGDELCDVCIQDCGECDPFCGDLDCDDEKMGACSDDPGTPCRADSECAGAATCVGYYQQEGCCADCQDCPADCGGTCGPFCGDGNCNLSNDETCLNCELDCGTCGGDCCVTHDGVGCDASDHATFADGAAVALASCVCEHEPECCTLEWGFQCLMAAVAECDTPCPYCGDGACDADFDETMETCVVDCCPNGICPEFCGNGICAPKLIGICADGADPPKACVSDDECGAVACEGYSEGETCSSCEDDCGQCSDGSCCEDGTATCDAGGDCGGCADPEVMTCVCDTLGLSSCCSGVWSDICVQMTFQHCDPSCETVCGDGICTLGTPETPETLGTCTDGADPPTYCTGDAGCSDGTTCEGYLPGQPGETLEDCAICPDDCGVCESECGNDICEADETCESCQDDCGPCFECGDNLCELPENCEICEDDCGECSDDCEDGVCQVGEDAINCPSDCEGILCGDGICVGVLEGNTEPQETALTCPEDCPDACGDGACTGAETCLICAGDCGACPPSVCGDGVCAGSDLGEGCDNCPADCSIGCLDLCDVFGPVCSGACDPLGTPNGCGENLACVPSKTTLDEPPDIPGTWYVAGIDAAGNGVCGMGFNEDVGFTSDGCSEHDDCCVVDPNTSESFCGSNNGFGCLRVQGLDQPGICGRACNPGTGAECLAGELCELSHFGPDAVGVCVPGGTLCDPTNPVASGCSPGDFQACVGLREEAKYGACFKGCSGANLSACDGVPAGDLGNTLSCIARTDAYYREGTCVGGGANSCDLTAADPCDPGGGDRCSILAASVVSGYSLYCQSPAGTSVAGGACTHDGSCVPAHICHSGACRPACSASAACSAGAACTPIGAQYGAPADAISVCLP